jgi:hypothetical protein
VVATTHEDVIVHEPVRSPPQLVPFEQEPVDALVLPPVAVAALLLDIEPLVTVPPPPPDDDGGLVRLPGAVSVGFPPPPSHEAAGIAATRIESRPTITRLLLQ